MDPGVQIRFSPSEPNADRGKEKPTHRLEAARVQGAPAREPVRFVRAPSLPPSSHRPAVSRSPFSNPHTATRHHRHLPHLPAVTSSSS